MPMAGHNHTLRAESSRLQENVETLWAHGRRNEGATCFCVNVILWQSSVVTTTGSVEGCLVLSQQSSTAKTFLV